MLSADIWSSIVVAIIVIVIIIIIIKIIIVTATLSGGIDHQIVKRELSIVNDVAVMKPSRTFGRS